MDYDADRRRLRRTIAGWANEIRRLEDKQRAGDKTIATGSALRYARDQKTEAERHLREVDELERRQAERHRRRGR